MPEAKGDKSERVRRRRLGYFGVACFATMCAALVPRLATIFASQPTSDKVESSSVLFWTFHWPYLGPALVLAVLVGGIVLVLKWDNLSTPGEIFMAALAVPALITGAVNGNQLTSDAAALTDQTTALANQLADAVGIPVEDGVPYGAVPQQGWDFSLVPSAYAAGGTEVSQSKGPTRFRQRRYWIVLDAGATETEAESAAERIGTAHVKVAVKKINDKYYVVLGNSPYPYATAVSKAVEVKRESEDALRPRLVPAATRQ